MTHLIDKTALVAEIERLIAELVEEGEGTMFEQGRISAFEDVKVFINHTLEVKEVEEEPVSKDMEEAAYQFGNCFENHFGLASMSFIKGAKWQKEQMITKACNYLFSHMGLFVTFINDDIVEDIESCEFIKKFRIAMEDNYETSGHK